MASSSLFDYNILTFAVSPKLLSRPNPTEYGYRGYDTVLNFTVFADPPAKIQWTRSGKKIQELEQSESSLTLSTVQYNDSGLYQAVARNLLGNVTVSTFLIVRDPGKHLLMIAIHNTQPFGDMEQVYHSFSCFKLIFNLRIINFRFI